MNRKLLALAVGAALALPVAAHAAPTVYGKLDLSVEHLDGDVGVAGVAADISDTTVETNKSRIGVRGEEKLNGALTAVYQVEWGVQADGDGANTSSGVDLGMRDRFLGLRHETLGTLRLGRMNTPLKEAEGKVDVFNNSRLDMENVFTGQNRENNSIAYTSPKLADALTLRFTQITEAGAASGGGSDAGQSMSVAFEQEGLYLAAALDNDVSGDADDGVLNAPAGSFYGATGLELDTIRLVAAVNVGDLRIGGLLQKAEGEGPGAQPEQTGYLLSAAYTVGKWTFKGQYAASEGEQGAADLGEITQIALGADYQWTQAFRTYGLLGQFEFDDPAPGNADTDLTLLGVGMALSF